MKFDLIAFLGTVLGGLNIPGLEAKIIGWLRDAEAKFPDLTARIAALETWITTTLGEVVPKLVLDSMKNTIFGIATDIIHGTAGVDPDSWGGMG